MGGRRIVGRNGIGGVSAILVLIGLLAASIAYAATGDLSQKPPPAGCVATGGAGGCGVATAFMQPRQIAISPDGENAYVTTSGSDSVAIFDRDPATGALTQKPVPAGCVSDTGGSGCQNGVGLDAAQGISVSADGESVYVAAFTSDAIAIFDRDTTTGELTQKPEPDACVSETGVAGGAGGTCLDGDALDSVGQVEVSPDGTSVYGAASVSDAVSVFDRDDSGGLSNGELTQKTGEAACISEAPVVGVPCDDGRALNGATEVLVSQDGASVYSAGNASDSVVIFDRDPVSGEIAQKPGTLGCISETGTGGTCGDGVALDLPQRLALSPDNSSLYVVASNSDAISVFDRNTATGALAQKPGTAACVSETGTTGACQDGFLLDGASGLDVSPDGLSVYAVSQAAASNAVTSFERSAGGALTQRTGPGACVSDTGSGGTCADGSALVGPAFVALGPEGTSVYAVSIGSFAVAILDREPFVSPPTPPGLDPPAADTAVPDTRITAGPKQKEKKKQATFEFTSTEPGSTFQCKLDDGAFEACSSPHDVKAGKGKHTFEVRARDAAGNLDPTPATQDWTVKKKKKKKKP